MNEIALGLALIGLLAYAVQTITGFGAMVISITVGALFVDIPTIKATMLPLSLATAFYLGIKHRAHARIRLILRLIVPLMGMGIIIGVVIADAAEGEWLKRGFAILVIILSARELLQLFFSSSPKPPPRAIEAGSYIGAGIIQGIYITGGPLLVYALGARRLEKASFRATIMLIWILLNSALCGWMIYAKEINTRTLELSLWVLPAVLIGLLVGEIAHRRIPERTFRIMLFALLMITSLILLARTFALL